MRSRPTLEQLIWLLSLASVPVFVWAARHMGWHVLLVPLAVPLMASMLRYPWLGYLVVTVTVSSAFWVYAFPEVKLYSHGVFVSEGVLCIALAAVFIRALRQGYEGGGVVTGIGVALAVYLLASMDGVLVGRANGASTFLAIQSARAILFFAAYWLAVTAFSKREWRARVLRYLAVIAVIVVVMQVAQIAVGPNHHLFLVGAYAAQITFMQGNFLRVRPPGLTLVYVTALFAASYLLWGPGEHRRIAWWLLGVTALGVLLSLNRNMILGSVLALGLTALPGMGRARVLRTLATLVVLVAAVAGLGVAYQSFTGHSNPVLARVTSIGNVQSLQSGTLEVRYSEDQLARKALETHPLLGIGWGTSYGATLDVWEGWRYVTEARPWIHNQYYGAWLRSGLAGLVALLAALGFTAWRGVEVIRRSANEVWLGRAVLAGIVGLSASAAVGMYFTEPASIVPLVGVMGLATVLARDVHVDTADTGDV